jgi:hypothetical protein
MSEHPIRIKSVNVHRNNDRMHGILQTDDDLFDILLIQEPWFDRVATLYDPMSTRRNYPTWLPL